MIVTPTNLRVLKDEARSLASGSAIALADAKDRVARMHGYSTWPVMLRQIESPLKAREQVRG